LRSLARSRRSFMICRYLEKSRSRLLTVLPMARSIVSFRRLVRTASRNIDKVSESIAQSFFSAWHTSANDWNIS